MSCVVWCWWCSELCGVVLVAVQVDRMIHEVRNRDKEASVFAFILDQSLMKCVLQICLERSRMMHNILCIFDWFHVGSWSLCALCQLTHKTFLHWFITELKLDKGNKIFNKFSIKKEYHFESLMMSMIEGLHLWLVSSIGNINCLSSPRRFHHR